MNIPFAFYPPEMQRLILRERKARLRRRLQRCVPWDPKMRWEPELNIQASTYEPRNLFPGAELTDTVDEEHGMLSPHGDWLYVNRELSRGCIIDTIYGGRVGSVVFDGPVLVPSLFQRSEDHWAPWGTEPWMSHTPMEVFSLRAGTRFAKGHVIIAGLGLGHQLIEVAKREQVKRITLIEREAQLVRWLLPHIYRHMPRPVDEVLIEDAYKVLPTLSADIALVDIFRSYGGNEFHARCPRIRRVWCWGAPEVRG